MADLVKNSAEVVAKFTLLSEDGTATATRSIAIPNPKELTQLRTAAANFLRIFGPNATGDNKNVIQTASWLDENDEAGMTPWITQAIQFSTVYKTETTLDLSETP